MQTQRTPQSIVRTDGVIAVSIQTVKPLTGTLANLTGTAEADLITTKFAAAPALVDAALKMARELGLTSFSIRTESMTVTVESNAVGAIGVALVLGHPAMKSISRTIRKVMLRLTEAAMDEGAMTPGEVRCD